MKAPEPTSRDLAAWRRLVREARACGLEPGRFTGDLAAAEKQARKALLIGPEARDNPCIGLVRAARRFVGETARGRREVAADLIGLAEQVELLLTAGPQPGATPEPPARRHRADIDG